MYVKGGEKLSGACLDDAVMLLGVCGLVVMRHGHCRAAPRHDAAGVPSIGHQQAGPSHQGDHLPPGALLAAVPGQCGHMKESNMTRNTP